jgi:flagellar motor switch protein FliN/FliY
LSWQGGARPGEPRNLELLLDVEVRVAVRLGGRQLRLRDVLELGVGSTFSLDQTLNDPVEVLVNGHLVARGRVVEVGEQWGVELTETVPPEDRLPV